MIEKKVLKLKKEREQEYAYSEAIKTLRTNIQFCGSEVNVIMFTSSVPDEGKSEISFAVAQSLTQIGKRTLFIDADIRKSMHTQRFHLKKRVNGLSQYLSGQRTLEDVLYGTSVKELDIILAGPYSPNPSELLEEEMFGDTIQKLRKEYDYIIIDTPPMGALIDGAIVSRHCDGAVLVIESGAVSRRVEQKVVEQLHRSECRILGAVLNKVDLHAKGYYGRYGKYGKYGKYGRYGKYKKYDRYDRYDNEGQGDGSYSKLDAAAAKADDISPVEENLKEAPETEEGTV